MSFEDTVKLLAIVSAAYSLYRIAKIYEFQKEEMIRVRDKMEAQNSGRMYV